MECRGVVGLHDARTDFITIWSATQVVHWLKREAAGVLRLPEAKIRCVALDVGGGFGVKGHVYPEDLLIPYLARRLGRPMKWIEDRHEHMLCSCHSRDQIHDVEIGFDDDGRILALRDHFVVDCGAWNPIGAGIAYNTAVHVPGPYKIGAIAISGRIAATNKVPNVPYPRSRPAGSGVRDGAQHRPRCHGARPRARRGAAAQYHPAAEMPYAVGMPYRDGQPIVLDGGDYPGALQKVLAALGGVEGFSRASAQGACRQGATRPRYRLLRRNVSTRRPAACARRWRAIARRSASIRRRWRRRGALCAWRSARPGSPTTSRPIRGSPSFCRAGRCVRRSSGGSAILRARTGDVAGARPALQAAAADGDRVALADLAAARARRRPARRGSGGARARDRGRARRGSTRRSARSRSASCRRSRGASAKRRRPTRAPPRSIPTIRAPRARSSARRRRAATRSPR